MKPLLRNVVIGLIAGSVGCALGACGGDDSDTGGSGGSAGTHTGGSSGTGGLGTGGGGTGGGGTGGTGTGGTGTGGGVVDDSGTGGSAPDGGSGGSIIDDSGTGGIPVTDAALSDAALIDGGMCPEPAPAEGTSCTERGACTYGGTVCRCSSSGDAGLDWACYALVATDGGNPTSCPGTKPAADSDCTAAGNGVLCRYESGDCLCNSRGGSQTWRCF